MPSMLHLFPRRRWTGSQRIFRSTALIAATHHLLRDVLMLWLTNSILIPEDIDATVQDEEGYESDAEVATARANSIDVAEAALSRQSTQAVPADQGQAPRMDKVRPSRASVDPCRLL